MVDSYILQQIDRMLTVAGWDNKPPNNETVSDNNPESDTLSPPNSELKEHGKDTVSGNGEPKESGIDADLKDRPQVSSNTLHNEHDSETSQIETQTETKTEASEAPNLGIDFAIGGATFLIIGLIVAVLVWKLNYQYDDIEDDVDDKYVRKHRRTKMNAVKIYDSFKGCMLRVGSIHDVGSRSMQQDSFGISDLGDKATVTTKGILAVVADGMGGLSDGERMSQIVVVNMLQAFDEADMSMPESEILSDALMRATNEVNNDLGEDNIGKCGSTVVAVIIRDNNLSYISVGDSHIYVWREGELVKINQDHNYAADLDAMVRQGELSLDEALNDPQRAALTSFIGMGRLELVDRNTTPIELMKGDRVLLMSDGVYGTISEDRLKTLLESSIRQSCMLIDNEIRTSEKPNQDNYTCVIIEIV